MTDMTRYQMNPPETSGRSPKERLELGQEVLDKWHKILVATKKAQMQLPPDKFPAEKFLPWGRPRDLDAMPVVVWIKRQPNAWIGRRRKKPRMH